MISSHFSANSGLKMRGKRSRKQGGNPLKLQLFLILKKVAKVAIIGATMDKQVGIKELKDQASSIVDSVEKDRKQVIITRNNRPIAKIVPITSAPTATDKDFFKSANEYLKEMGRISKIPKHDWSSLNLKKISAPNSDSVAIRAISEDRDER
jgi:prevent-host-death family protein